MNSINHVVLCLLVLVGMQGCHSNSIRHSNLTPRELSICDSLQMDTSVITAIRQYSQGDIGSFESGLGTKISSRMEDTDPVFLKGIIFPETNEKAHDVVINLKNLLRKKGYTIFLADNNFNFENQPDYISVLRTTDQYKVLQQIKTDGINFNITNDSLITIIRNFDKELKLELIGAADDWCEFLIHKDPVSWLKLSQEVYKVCPDVVDQGTGSIEALANEMQRSRRLYLWWD